ncbi:MAG TPA: hypothetical protein VD908_16115 [Cytophagales bacterium]|nr:hypothetical protein [Cytophagales bacterium]
MRNKNKQLHQFDKIVGFSLGTAKGQAPNESHSEARPVKGNTGHSPENIRGKL